MTAVELQSEHFEYARRVLSVPPEIEKEKPIEVQAVLLNFLGEIKPEESTPEAMERFLKNQEYFASLPDPN
jgi:hypothetical protein